MNARFSPLRASPKNPSLGVQIGGRSARGALSLHPPQGGIPQFKSGGSLRFADGGDVKSKWKPGDQGVPDFGGVQPWSAGELFPGTVIGRGMPGGSHGYQGVYLHAKDQSEWDKQPVRRTYDEAQRDALHWLKRIGIKRFDVGGKVPFVQEMFDFAKTARGMAEGGEVDPFRMPMREAADASRAERGRPRIRQRILPIEEEDMGALRKLSQPERQMAMLASTSSSARDRQRAALHELYNAGPLSKMAAQEDREGWNDLGAAFLDPTSLPINFSGGLTALGARALPKLVRRFRGSMPWKARAGEFGGWMSSGPNIKEARPGEMRPTGQFGLEPLPASQKLIGDQ